MGLLTTPSAHTCACTHALSHVQTHTFKTPTTMAADRRPGVNFEPQRRSTTFRSIPHDVSARIHRGWITYNPDKDGSVGSFVRSFPPSNTGLRGQRAVWIQCRSPTASSATAPDLGPLKAHLACLARGEITKAACVQRLLAEGQRQQTLTGKWMLFPRCNVVDATWAIVAQATVEGRLGFSAKVSTNDPEHDTQVICVYVRDSADRVDVCRVLRELQHLGCDVKGFKMDLYTYLGIGHGNPWGLSPCLYSPKDFFSPPQLSSGKSAKKKRQQHQWFHRLAILAGDTNHCVSFICPTSVTPGPHSSTNCQNWEPFAPKQCAALDHGLSSVSVRVGFRKHSPFHASLLSWVWSICRTGQWTCRPCGKPNRWAQSPHLTVALPLPLPLTQDQPHC